jgi:hypothetical protein
MKVEPAFDTAAPFSENEASLRMFINLNAQVLGITLGILSGLGIFLATNILLLKGGENMGAHLQLLGQFFYGYKVSFFGSVLGLIYGFMVGYIAGGIVAVIYNWVNFLRSR